jgi:GntP family gluconate:H+ symporter
VALVARRLRLPIVAVGIPALAGLSVLHGLVPPHPGPLVAIDALGANLGLTLLFGLATAIPTVLVAGPLFAKLAVRWVPVTAPDVAPDGKADVPAEAPEEQRRGRVGVGAAVVVVLVPVVLMLIRAVAEVTLPDGDGVRSALEVAGEPIVALLVGVVTAIVLLGLPAGMDRHELSRSIGGSLPPIAGILLIVGAGSGFKQT